MDHGRDPCPWVILNDFGGAFCMGVRPSPLLLRSGDTMLGSKRLTGSSL